MTRIRFNISRGTLCAYFAQGPEYFPAWPCVATVKNPLAEIRLINSFLTHTVASLGGSLPKQNITLSAEKMRNPEMSLKLRFYARSHPTSRKPDGLQRVSPN